MLKTFSHIYIEDAAREYPDCQEILKRFSRAQQVSISHYKEVFNRGAQDSSLQRLSRKLILAVKTDGLLYPGSAVTPDFGNKNFFYNSLILNCLYDCHYCYLQGLYPSANIVIFVNGQDYFKEIEKQLDVLEDVYVCISYDTDLLAFEDIIPQVGRWIEFARAHPKLKVELRTKSVNIKPILTHAPINNFILAWTLSPAYVVENYEPVTPSLEARLNAMRQVQQAGWNVRICYDPLLQFENWQAAYQELVAKTFQALDSNKISEVSLGTFRMNPQHLKRVKNLRPNSLLLAQAFVRDGPICGYNSEQKNELIRTMRSVLLPHIDEAKIYSI